jgi:predicted peroxiredoxin
MMKKIAILLWVTDPEQPHLCGTPFFHAAAAAAVDAEVEVFFTSKAVKLLVAGVAASIHPSSNQEQTVYEFMQHAAQHGACPQALHAYAIEETSLIPECSGIAGAGTFVSRVMDDDWRALTF